MTYRRDAKHDLQSRKDAIRECANKLSRAAVTLEELTHRGDGFTPETRLPFSIARRRKELRLRVWPVLTRVVEAFSKELEALLHLLMRRHWRQLGSDTGGAGTACKVSGATR